MKNVIVEKDGKSALKWGEGKNYKREREKKNKRSAAYTVYMMQMEARISRMTIKIAL